MVDAKPSVIAIGKFDGAHIGHLAIFHQMMKIAREKRLKSLAITFSNPPRLPGNDRIAGRIYTKEEKRENLRRIGIDCLVELPFNEELQRITGEEFLRNILIGKMNMKIMVCGEDCAFGYQKSGNLELLERLKEELGYEIVVVEKVRDENDQEISSSLIRDLLSEGRMEEVNRLIGGNFSIRGIVEAGNRLGHTIGYPTANLFPEKEKILPKTGVYASRVKIIGTGEEFNGLTNIGTNPSIAKDARKHALRVETYIVDFDRDIYGEEVEVSFLKYIRGEKRFSCLEELKEQLDADLALAYPHKL